jgi:hypothetical protein
LITSLSNVNSNYALALLQEQVIIVSVRTDSLPVAHAMIEAQTPSVMIPLLYNTVGIEY